jgi:hypothetical protein
MVSFLCEVGFNIRDDGTKQSDREEEKCKSGHEVSLDQFFFSFFFFRRLRLWDTHFFSSLLPYQTITKINKVHAMLFS